MELGGNLWERPVTIGNAIGRAFTGAHGDGKLTAAGDADVAGWPGTSSEGAGFRGAGWNHTATFTRVSDRTYADTPYAPRSFDYGFHAVRSAPAGVQP